MAETEMVAAVYQPIKGSNKQIRNIINQAINKCEDVYGKVVYRIICELTLHESYTKGINL